jgi:hypothetical protein
MIELPCAAPSFGESSIPTVEALAYFRCRFRLTVNRWFIGVLGTSFFASLGRILLNVFTGYQQSAVCGQGFGILADSQSLTADRLFGSGSTRSGNDEKFRPLTPVHICDTIAKLILSASASGY